MCIIKYKYNTNTEGITSSLADPIFHDALKNPEVLVSAYALQLCIKKKT